MTRVVDSGEVYEWPEFIAFARRLGIDLSQPAPLQLSIRLERGCMVYVDQAYHAVERDYE